MARTSNGCPCSLILAPTFRSSPDCRFTSKVPKRRIRCEELKFSAMWGPQLSGQFTIAQARDKIRLALERLRQLLQIQLLIARQTFELPCIDVPTRLHQAGGGQATREKRTIK